MELHIRRHAIAVTLGTEGFSQDPDRPLTDTGRSRLRRVVRGMKALDLSFHLILTSPYLRARQTAEIVAAEMGAEKSLSQTPHLTLKKAGLCKLVAQRLRYGRCASLEWLLAPAQMERIR